MSSESGAPRYHTPWHAQIYDERGISLPGAELEMLCDEIDELLYPDPKEEITIATNSARAGRGGISTYFSHEYLSGEREGGWAWPLESVTVSVDHSIYKGRVALKQCFKVKIDNSIIATRSNLETVSVTDHPITSIYYIEEFAAAERSFSGSIIRPNIIGEEHPKDEPMTRYDCEKLYDSIAGLRTLAIYTGREQQALRRMA